MSNGAQPDYDALAKQAGAIPAPTPTGPAGGATVDYDQLAQQAGAIGSGGANANGVPDKLYIKDSQGITREIPNDYLAKAEDMIHGFGIGAVKNIPFVGDWLRKTLGEPSQTGVVNPQYEQAGETGGRAYEQALEMAAGSGALKATAGAALGESLPWLRRLAPLGRIGAEAATAGTSAAAHGQPIGPAAAIGGGGAAASELLAAAAPKAAETALNITARMRGRGRTIGEAALGEIGGIRPGTMSAQAEEQLKNIGSQIEGSAHDATLAGAVGSTQGAHNALDAAIAKTPRNAPEIIDKLEELRDKLGFPFDPANPQTRYTPDELLEMKRGIGKAIKTWPTEWQSNPDLVAAKMRLYGTLDGELDRLVPGFNELNQRYSSLKPVQQQAEQLSNAPGVMQRVMGRVKAPTGALTAAALGAGGGYYHGGIAQTLPGAAAGFLGGLFGPELIATPEAQMAMARLMRLGIPTAIARGVVASREPAPGAAGQFGRTF